MPINAVERFVDSRLHGNDTGVDFLDCFTSHAMMIKCHIFDKREGEIELER